MLRSPASAGQHWIYHAVNQRNRQSATAAIGLPIGKGRQPASVVGERLLANDRRCSALQNLSHPAGQIRRDPVVDPLPLTPVGQQAGRAQLSEVFREVWLWCSQGFGKVTDAQLLAPEQQDDAPQADFMR